MQTSPWNVFSGVNSPSRRDCVGTHTNKSGVPGLLDTLQVKHFDPDGRHDGWSELGFKSYQQGRSSFEGTEKHFIWLDEEPPMDIYGECLIRTMDTKLGTTNGSIVLTFTPLEGMSTVVLSFMPAEMRPAM